MLAAAAPVRAPTTTSTSGILCTGLKKCMPTTCCGSGTSAAISSIGSDEVLDASTVPGGTWAATSANTFCLTASFSTIASITRSTRWKES